MAVPRKNFIFKRVFHRLFICIGIRTNVRHTAAHTLHSSTHMANERRKKSGTFYTLFEFQHSFRKIFAFMRQNIFKCILLNYLNYLKITSRKSSEYKTRLENKCIYFVYSCDHIFKCFFQYYIKLSRLSGEMYLNYLKIISKIIFNTK